MAGQVPYVLIVDDDPALAEALKLRCEAQGWEASTSPDGLFAYMKMIDRRPDLVVMDINMPMDGLTLRQRMLQHDLAEVPVIALSGASEETVRERCERLGVEFVFKGLEIWKELEPRIRQRLTASAD